MFYTSLTIHIVCLAFCIHYFRMESNRIEIQLYKISVWLLHKLYYYNLLIQLFKLPHSKVWQVWKIQNSGAVGICRLCLETSAPVLRVLIAGDMSYYLRLVLCRIVGRSRAFDWSVRPAQFSCVSWFQSLSDCQCQTFSVGDSSFLVFVCPKNTKSQILG
jgi:hypothetical protein